MGPYRVFGATISLSFSCINQIDLIHQAISIPIVLMPIGNLIFNLVQRFYHHFSSMKIVSYTVVDAIVRILFADGNGTYHIEIQFKQAAALGFEIVGFSSTT